MAPPLSETEWHPSFRVTTRRPERSCRSRERPLSRRPSILEVLGPEYPQSLMSSAVLWYSASCSTQTALREEEPLRRRRQRPSGDNFHQLQRKRSCTTERGFAGYQPNDGKRVWCALSGRCFYGSGLSKWDAMAIRTSQVLCTCKGRLSRRTTNALLHNRHAHLDANGRLLVGEHLPKNNYRHSEPRPSEKNETPPPSGG